MSADLCQTPEIAGPGFINLRGAGRPWLVGAIDFRRTRRPFGRAGGREAADLRGRLYSAPNVAKPMHVGQHPLDGQSATALLPQRSKFPRTTRQSATVTSAIGARSRHDPLRLQKLLDTGSAIGKNPVEELGPAVQAGAEDHR